jgi:hypothetical protein
MLVLVAASALAVQLANASAAAPESVPPPAKIPEEWAAPPPPSRKAIDKAVHDTVAEENTEQAAVPRRSDTFRSNKYDDFAASFDEAAVPGCLRPDGLKRQPPRIGPIAFRDLFGLPFILIAKARGKCN